MAYFLLEKFNFVNLPVIYYETSLSRQAKNNKKNTNEQISLIMLMMVKLHSRNYFSYCE